MHIGRLPAYLILIVVVTVSVAAVGPGRTDTTDSTPPSSTKYVTVTFDDAYASQYRAADELEDRGMRGVFFVPVNQLNGTFEGIPTMTQQQVRNLVTRGHEIGGHTYNHTNLSTLSPRQVRRSLQQNKAALNRLGITAISFAYPYGAGASYASIVGEEYRFGRLNRWKTNTVPLQNRSRLTSISLSEDTYEYLELYLQRMKPGDWLIIMLHGIDANSTVNRETIDMSTETYQQVLDTVQATNITTITFKDAAALTR